MTTVNNKLTQFNNFDRTVITILKWVFLLAVAAFMLYPILYAVLGSFKTNQELTSSASLLPNEWQWNNFTTALNIANFGRYFGNSLFLCFFVVVGSLLTSSLSAYCIARHEFPGRRLLTILYTAMMFISIGPVMLRPVYDLAVVTGTNKSLWPVVFILIGGQSVNIFILQAYMRGIPRELDEAAMIDGASIFTLYWRIIMPLSTPALGVVALFQFRLAWNEYLWPLVFTLTNPALRPLSVGIAALRYNDTAATQWNLMLTGATISIIPMLIVYLLTNRAFISGQMQGALKG
jgi:raffinose/stachyose/melibiose transport system permease protein